MFNHSHISKYSPMKSTSFFLWMFLSCCFLSSCISNKKHASLQQGLQQQLDVANADLGKLGTELNDYIE